MADSREIVGWFFKNGKRIPIKAKSGLHKDGQTTARTSAQIEKGKVNDFYKFARTQGEPVHPDILEYVAENRVQRTRENRDMLRKNVNARRASKYITEKRGPMNNKFYSTDYDTTGGHVHKDHDTVDEARDFLRRNNMLSPKKINKKRGK